MSFNPDDLGAVETHLQEYLSGLFPKVRLSEGPSRIKGGLDTHIYRFHLTDVPVEEWQGPLILRIYPTREQGVKARREFAVQLFVSSQGFPAPTVLAVEDEGSPFAVPFMIMECVPGRPLVDSFKNPLSLRGALRGMADLHVRLHNLPIDGCPLPSQPSLVERQLTAARNDIDRFQLKGLDGPLAWLQESQRVVQDEQLSMLHNDFHPLNIMTDGQNMSVIDWSDAALGDRHHDLARTLALFELAPPLARSWFERSILRMLRRYVIPQYLSRYQAALPVDPERLRFWQALHAFKAWIQLLALESDATKLGAREGAAAEVPPGLLPAIRDYFHHRTTSGPNE